MVVRNGGERLGTIAARRGVRQEGRRGGAVRAQSVCRTQTVVADTHTRLIPLGTD